MTMHELLKEKAFWIFIALMICAGSSEIAMAQWASAFAESALHVSKNVGDDFGKEDDFFEPDNQYVIRKINDDFYRIEYENSFDIEKNSIYRIVNIIMLIFLVIILRVRPLVFSDEPTGALIRATKNHMGI